MHPTKVPYPNVLKSLYNQNLISSNIFSLYLTKTETIGSKLIFGGFDLKYA